MRFEGKSVVVTGASSGMGRVMAGLDSSIPQGSPKNIADVVLFLASEGAAFMTGAEIVVDGGVSCN